MASELAQRIHQKSRYAFDNFSGEVAVDAALAPVRECLSDLQTNFIAEMCWCATDDWRRNRAINEGQPVEHSPACLKAQQVWASLEVK